MTTSYVYRKNTNTMENMKDFKKAFAWMQKVQEACLFMPGFSVDVERQFTPANHREDSIHGFTCMLDIRDSETGDRYIAEYRPWYGYKAFAGEKAVVEKFLTEHGIHISDVQNPLTESELDDIREAVLCRMRDIATARDNMPKFTKMFDKEIKNYNEILAKLA